ncbi:MAG TPA: hypothetical protein VHB99_11310 [Pirellulales bacterium]|nr:hypothetical protein [Pirellulales bacterium]
MNFAKWVFRVAGIYGLIVLTPNYFLEQQIGQNDPPAITHPEYFYGFTGLAISWQVVFLLISRDPLRYRPLMMLAAILEKAPFGIAAIVLFALHRISGAVLCFGIIDLTLGALFVASYWLTRSSPGAGS